MDPHDPFYALNVPPARVVKQGARRLPHTSLREDLREFVTPSARTREALATLVGLWPLLIVVAMAVALLWTAGYHGMQP